MGMLLAVSSLLAGCSSEDSLQRIKQRGELVVVTRNSPATYYLDKNGPTGFEYALASRFAEELGVALVMEPEHTLADLFRRLDRNEADLAAAGLTLTPQRSTNYPSGAAYHQTASQVVYRAGSPKPRQLQDLYGEVVLVIAGSSHEQALARLREGGHEDIQWRAMDGGDSLDLLREVDAGTASFALLDSTAFTLQQSLYPRLKVGFELGQVQSFAWLLPPAQDHIALQARLKIFFDKMRDNGQLEALKDRHFGHARTVSRVGSHTFNQRMRKRLPTYRDMIRQVALEYQLDWHLLAAIAYQESHWAPDAVSPTGVRGFMMLTNATAQEMGIEDRRDPLQSLRGGARYLNSIKRRLPQDIYEPDRTWFTLAAYNIGMGHLEDARVITERLGGDPHLWSDVMEHLPLLRQSQYYQSTRYGYARGSEPVTYVQNIRHYYAILKWQDIADSQAPAPIDTAELLPEMVRGVNFRAL